MTLSAILYLPRSLSWSLRSAFFLKKGTPLKILWRKKTIIEQGQCGAYSVRKRSGTSVEPVEEGIQSVHKLLLPAVSLQSLVTLGLSCRHVAFVCDSPKQDQAIQLGSTVLKTKRPEQVDMDIMAQISLSDFFREGRV